MKLPTVSVICLCYNHRSYLNEAFESVKAQTYPDLQIILVDDASTDGSQELIREISQQHPEVETILLPENVGNCKAFNCGWRRATGEFIIDFSTDDVMLPDRIERQVDFFRNQKNEVGVVFTDAMYINAEGDPIESHFDYLFKKKLIDDIPQGDVFRDVLTTYFICSPTMMMRRTVMESLQGYDEELSYEDFDFWVRASRHFHFAFLNEKLTKVRRLSNSMSSGWYRQGDRQLYSTFLVCQKAVTLCQDERDRAALRWRVLYEFKQSVFSENKKETQLFRGLLMTLGGVRFSYFLILIASFIPMPWAWLRKKYYQFFYS